MPFLNVNCHEDFCEPREFGPRRFLHQVMLHVHEPAGDVMGVGVDGGVDVADAGDGQPSLRGC